MPYKKVYFPKKSVNTKGAWPEAKKVELLQAYLALGNLRLSAASVGVPEITARQWKATQWWKDTESELRSSSHIQLSTKLQNIVEKALVQLEDRVDNGDYVLTRSGELVRKGISAEHANKIVTQLVDRRLVLEKAATKDREDDAGLEARLKQIRDELVTFAKKPDLAKQVIEGEVIEVVSPNPIEEVIPEEVPNASPRTEPQENVES